MKLTIELDSSQPASGQHAIDLIGRIFGTAPQVVAPLAPIAPVMAAPASPPAPTGQPAAPAPVYAPPAPSLAPPGTAPAAPAPPAPTSPTPQPVQPVVPAAPGQVTPAMFSEAVQKYAGVHAAKGAKARFAQMAEAFGQPTWINTSSIPADRLADVMPWFQV